jgi:hypothetical protein
MRILKKSMIETHRRVWADAAKKNNWYTEPFFIQMWVEMDGKLQDSVSTRTLTKDVVISAHSGKVLVEGKDYQITND